MINSTSKSTQLPASEPAAPIAAPSQAKNSKPSFAANSSLDTVHLSDTAQAAALYHQGFNIVAISSRLGVPDDTIDNYLGLNSITGQVVIPPATSKTAAAVA